MSHENPGSLDKSEEVGILKKGRFHYPILEPVLVAKLFLRRKLINDLIVTMRLDLSFPKVNLL